MGDLFTRLQSLTHSRRCETDVDSFSDVAASALLPVYASHVCEPEKLEKLAEEMENIQSVAREIQSLSTFRPADTAWERFKNLFISNIYGYRSMEFKAAYTMGIIGAVCGFFVQRRSISTRNALQRFKVQHNLSLFESKRDYQVRLATFIGANRLRDDLPNCLRLAAICSLSTFTITGLAAVCDRLLYTDFIAGYAVYYLELGCNSFDFLLLSILKAAFATGLIGSLFGVSFVVILQPYLLYRGQSLDQFYKEYRQEFYLRQYQKGKFDQELVDVMSRYNLSYFAGIAKVKELRELEKRRLSTIRNMNIDASLNRPPWSNSKSDKITDTE